MEFQEGLMRMMIQEPEDKQWRSRRNKKTPEKKSSEKESATTTARKWKLFNKSPSSSKIQSKQMPPSEFLCPITGSLMAEPVIVSSGHTFERACVEACKALDLTLTLPDSSRADFSSVIPNLALKSTIAAWCKTSSIAPPTPLASASAENLVRAFVASRCRDSPANTAATGSARGPRRSGFGSSFSSAESVQSMRSMSTPSPSKAPLPIPVAETSPSSSSEIEIQSHKFLANEEDILAKLDSQQVFEAEEGLVSLRKITRTREDARAHLCTKRLLSALRPLIASRYTGIQVNAVAALVNLSLESSNKNKIVRSGIVPPLIDVLKSGSAEAQEHAAGAIFSLALDDDSKTAIGVLGALQPLLHLLRAESERTRHDSALALYHLSLVQTNRSKLVKFGSVPVLLNMVRSGHMTGRILLVLGNLGLSADGRVAMLDAGAVECMVEVLRAGEPGPNSVREGEASVSVLHGLSLGGLRFRALAKAGRVAEALSKVEESGWSERARRKARAVVEAIKGREEEEEEYVNWEELLEDGLGTGPDGSRSDP